MRHPDRSLAILVVSLTAVIVAGCATTQSRRAARAMYEGDYARAIPLLTALALERPSHAKTWARLGEAYYHAGQPTEARESLERALELDVELAQAHLFLGYIAEKQDSLDLALIHYQRYLGQRQTGKTARDVAQRVEMLRRQRAQEFARQALDRERELRPSGFSDSTVGVVYFNADQLSDQLRPLAKGLAEMLVTDLSKVPGLRVVERLRTEKLLEELALSRTAAFDTSTAPRLGKLLRAAHILGGDASELSHGRLRLDPQMVRTTTGDIFVGDEQVGELAEFFLMEKAIVFDVVDQLGFTLSPAERDSLAHLPTERFVAFLAFARGLDLLDRGLYQEAHDEFERAASLDPEFREAQERLQQTSLLTDLGPDDMPSDIETFATRTTEESEWQEFPVRTDQRLGNLMENSGLTRPVGSERVSDDPYTPPAGRTTVIINGTFDREP